MELKKESGVVKMVHFYQYRNIPIFIRNYYDCYEFVFAINNKVFTDYIQLVKGFNKKENEYLKEEIISRLVSVSSKSIDLILEQRSWKHKLNKIIYEIRKLGHQWFNGIQPQEQSATDKEPVGISE